MTTFFVPTTLAKMGKKKGANPPNLAHLLQMWRAAPMTTFFVPTSLTKMERKNEQILKCKNDQSNHALVFYIFHSKTVDVGQIVKANIDLIRNYFDDF